MLLAPKKHKEYKVSNIASDSLEHDFMDDSKRKKVISGEFIHKKQAEHFYLLNVIPLILFVICIPIATKLPFGITEISLFLGVWIITGLGISSGYHRLFTHRSYKAKRPLRLMLHFSGALAGQGGVISWAALHRRHHETSDQEGDPHSPNQHGSGFINKIRGLLHSHFLWMKKHDYPNVVHYVPDLLKDKDACFIDKHYYKIVLTGFVIPAMIGGAAHHSWEGVLSGLIWGGIFRLMWGANTIWAINSFVHVFGTKRFRTRDNSHNIGVFGILTFGEAWHNNHHAFPGSASFGLEWYNLDPAYWFIRLMSLSGQAYNIKTPSQERINYRKTTAV